MSFDVSKEINEKQPFTHDDLLQQSTMSNIVDPNNSREINNSMPTVAIVNNSPSISACFSPFNSSNSDEKKRISENKTFRVYRIRYFLLLIFILLSMSNAFQWIEYAIIETIISDYYRINTFWINCTSVVYMVSYIIGIVPATWILKRYGLRKCLIIGALSNALGSWIKCFSIHRQFFWITMLGQMVVAFAQLFILNIPPLLSATWFSPNEITRSTAFGVFGNQVGIALGFLFPPLLMPKLSGDNIGQFNNSDSNVSTSTTPSSSESDHLTSSELKHIEWGLKVLFYSGAVITTLIFLVISVFFRNRPKCPPSYAQALQQEMNSNESYLNSMKNLMKNASFMLLLVSYGINTGVFYAVSTVLSQMITRALGEKYLVEAGYMGLSITLSGIVGSVICGYILGWSKKYKLVTLVVYIFALLGCVAFTIAIQIQSIILLFVVCSVLGFFMTGYLPIGFEFAAEVSFPSSEGISAGLLNASAQVFGIILTFGSSPIIETYGSIYVNIGYIVILAFGAVLTIMVKNDLHRQNVNL